VRVALDPREVATHPLRIGLSTRASVDVRNESGAQLAQAPRKEPVLSTDIYAIDFKEARARIAQIVADNEPVAALRPAPKVGSARAHNTVSSVAQDNTAVSGASLP
jgi:membrane fusion protein (multidrug efflux system)